MYYPSSQIKTDLYSNKDLMVISTQIPYVGYYWSTSTGKFFVGNNPNSPQSFIELTQNTKTSASPGAEPDFGQPSPYIDGNINTYAYAELKDVDINTAPGYPKFIPNIPQKIDYEAGEFTRFFCKKVNESLFIEITPNDYSELLNNNPNFLYHLLIPFKLNWAISGDSQDVYNENKNIVEYLESTLNLQGLSKHLRHNYLQYVDITPGIQSTKFSKIYKDSGEEVPANLPPTYRLGNMGATKGKQCSNCIFYQQGLCRKWEAPIRGEYWCVSWKINPSIINSPNQQEPLDIYTGLSNNKDSSLSY